MKPYYADESVTLYHGDCREVTAWLEADVLVTDPPYGVAYVSNHGNERTAPIAGDVDTLARDAALEMWGSDLPALCFGSWKAPRPATTRQVLVWDKSEGNGNGGMLWSPWRPSHEEIYVMGEWPPIKSGGRLREGGTPARLPGVIRVPNYNVRSARRPEHPTPKPVALMVSLLAQCPKGLIADPFAGSGATLVAAKQLGRKAIGVEVDERHCETTAARLVQGVLDFGVGA